jgi:VCBS repeat-containing protein
VVENITLTTANITAGSITREVTAPANGSTLNVQAQLIDQANNVSPVGSDSAVIDTVSPTAVADTQTANENITTLTGNVGTNDTNKDGSEAYSLSGSATGSFGSLVLNSNGDWTYTVDEAKRNELKAITANAVETFSYSVTDAAGNSTSSTLAITLTPVNDAPVNTVPGEQSTAEDTAKAITGLSIVDVDAGNSALTVTLAVTNGTITAATSAGVSITTNGTASVTLSGTVSAINTLLALANGVTYTPTANFNGSATLTMTTNDGGNTGSGGAKSDVDTVTINVTAVNDAPVAVNDTATIGEAGGTNNGTPGNALTSTTSGVTALNVLANDTDVDAGDTLSVKDIKAGTA